MGSTNLPDPRTTPRFAGLVTFGRYPRLDEAPPASRPVDWAIYGVPHDAGVTYRPGARFGPRAIREESQYLKRFHLEHELDVCGVLSLADAGDAPVKPYALRESLEGVAAWAAGLGDRGHTKLLALGGDHSTAFANLRATWERRGKPSGGLALVHFDSHLDTVDKVWGEGWGHASVFIRAVEEGLVDPRAMISVGVKGPLNSGGDLDFARARGVRLVTHAQGRERGDAALREFARGLGDREAYITIDIDVLDPAFAPGTGTPCPGGLSTADLFALLRALRGIRVAGGDVVEVLPDRDVGGITALAAAHAAFEVLALDAVSR